MELITLLCAVLMIISITYTVTKAKKKEYSGVYLGVVCLTLLAVFLLGIQYYNYFKIN